MAWNDAPPTKEELNSTSEWAKEPPTAKELGLPDVSKTESGLRGLVNQFNLAPVVSAAAQHPIEAAEAASNPLLRLLGKSEFSPEDTAGFNAARQESNTAFKQAEQANPATYMAGNIAGGLATALIPGVNVGKGVAGAAKLGASIGALTGAGQALSEGKDVSDVAASAGLQGALGGALGGVIGKVGSALNPEALESNAAKNAVEAFNPSKSEVSKLLKAPARGEGSRLEEVGGILNKPTQFLNGKSILEASGSPESNLERLNLAQENAGKFLGSVAEKVDESGQKLVTPTDIVSYIEELQKPYSGISAASKEAGLPKQSFVDEFNALNRIKQDVLEYGNNPISFSEAEAIKKDISALAYKDNGAIANADMAKLRGFVNDKLEEALDTAAPTLKDPDLYNKYIEAKDLYGATKQIQKSAEGNAAKELSNKDLGLTDYLLGGAGYSAHGGLGATAAIGAKKVLESKYNASAAKIQQGTANVMRDISSTIAEWTPEQFKSISSKMIQSGDPTAMKLGNILSKTADKDATGRNAVIFSIMQNPSYREFMRDITGNQ